MKYINEMKYSRKYKKRNNIVSRRRKIVHIGGAGATELSETDTITDSINNVADVESMKRVLTTLNQDMYKIMTSKQIQILLDKLEQINEGIELSEYPNIHNNKKNMI